MHFLKLKNYVEQLDYLLRQERAGTAIELAQKLGVSERTLRNHLQQLRDIGIKIVYDPKRKTYKYPRKGSIIFIFNPEDMGQIRGGINSTSNGFLGDFTLTNLSKIKNMLNNM